MDGLNYHPQQLPVGGITQPQQPMVQPQMVQQQPMEQPGAQQQQPGADFWREVLRVVMEGKQ